MAIKHGVDSRFDSGEMAEANQECGDRPEEQYVERCKKCGMKVVLHCFRCEIQVSGCLCTDVDRFGESAAIQKIIEREGIEQARIKLARAGIWIPPGVAD